MVPHQGLANLLRSFSADVELANQLASPNRTDDLPIKVAIIGFSHNSPIEQWAQNHFSFVKARIEGDYSSANLIQYQPHAENVRLFAALCIGYLLGLYQAEKINDGELARSEAIIPGLIALRNKEIG
jgi:hypothetical protein